ncbi:MAG TPA: serpin family protein [Allosphingosinicella sp.]|nr:serpin family protein [Allosphingosinicella sp.]
MSAKRIGFVLAALLIGLPACSASQMEPEPGPQQRVTPALPEARAPAPPPADLAAGQAEFAVDLYRRLGAQPGNIFLSPASISAALAMVYAGAEGETAAQMAEALRYPAGPGFHEGMGALLRRLPIEAEGRVLRIANALWVQRDFALRPEYSQLVKRHYGGEATPVDFVAAPEQAIATVNRWAEDKTAGRIKGVIQRSNVTVDTRLILTNSIYFKGDWLRPFSANHTRQRPFRLPGGRSVPATFMRQRSSFRVLREPGFEALEAPYKGEELSMILFVPERPEGLAQFESSLTAQKLDGWIGKLMAEERSDVELVMPKLQLTTRASLVPELQALGMRRAFSNSAELGGIAAPARLRLSDVIHQTFLLVDEKGTEAAAVTAGIAEIVSMPREFHADRPFFFLIRDNRSGTILFLGRISDPRTMI